MKTEQYWQRRMEDLNEAELKKGEDYIKAQNVEYDKAMARIKKETEAWYARLAKNNDISMAEARKLLTANELKEFHWDVQEYIKAGRENAVDQRWMKQLENASAKVHITRLEEMETKLQQEVELLAAKRLKGTSDVMGDIYKDGYYKGIHEVQRGTGEGLPFAKLDTKQIDKVLSKPWAPDGRNFSARIWADRDKLIAELQTVLTQDLIRGENADKVIADFADRMGVSKHAAARLIRTESAYFSGQSRLDGYKESDVTHYKYVATLDARTSTICQDMDGKIIPISEAKAGVNYPPLHAFCRSTTIPHFDDVDDDDEVKEIGERAARGEDGKTYYVPGDMTYKDWAAKHAPPDATEPAKATDPPATEPPKVKSVNDETEPSHFNEDATFHVDLPDIKSAVSKKVAEVNREITKAGSITGNESFVLLDKETGEILNKLEGDTNTVNISSLHDFLRNATRASIIATHNHPKSTTFSFDDINTVAMYGSIDYFLASGHNGKVYTTSAQKNLPNYIDFLDFVKKFKKDNLPTFLEMVKQGIMSTTEANVAFDRLIAAAAMKQFGFYYKEEDT